MSTGDTLVREAVGRQGGRWFEGLGSELARAKWLAVAEATGLGPESYGTMRYALRDRSAPRETFCAVDLPGAFGTNRGIAVEILRGDVLARYVDLGLDFQRAVDIDARLVADRLRGAFGRIAEVPGAAAAVGAVLATLHVLRPEGPDYDVSYSDPAVPFSAFVGIPGAAQANGDLRLAEGILHECMHLQLSLIEEVLPLVAGTDERLHSPWQGTMRPVQGILHGLYVFRVIQDFHRALVDGGRGTPEERGYLLRRVECVDREISGLTGLERSGELTDDGRRLVAGLLAG